MISLPTSQKYAYRTTVQISKSEADIKNVLKKYGAKNIATGERESGAMIMFEIDKRVVRFEIKYHLGDDQENRRLWRCLFMSIKSKLELVASDLSMFEHEFLAQIVMPGGRTVADEVLPAIALAYEGNTAQKLLPDWSGPTS